MIYKELGQGTNIATAHLHMFVYLFYWPQQDLFSSTSIAPMRNTIECTRIAVIVRIYYIGRRPLRRGNNPHYSLLCPGEFVV